MSIFAVNSQEDDQYLSDEKQYCFSVIEMNRADIWFPVGIREIKDGGDDFQGSCEIAERLAEFGRLTCIDPTSAWTFITIDVVSGPFRVRPFTMGKKDSNHIAAKFAELKKEATERLEQVRGKRKQPATEPSAS